MAVTWRSSAIRELRYDHEWIGEASLLPKLVADRLRRSGRVDRDPVFEFDPLKADHARVSRFSPAMCPFLGLVLDEDRRCRLGSYPVAAEHPTFKWPPGLLL